MPQQSTPVQVEGRIVKIGNCRNGEPRFYFAAPQSTVKRRPEVLGLAGKKARIEFTEIGLTFEGHVLIYRYQIGIVKFMIYIPCALSSTVKQHYNGAGIPVTARIWPY